MKKIFFAFLFIGLLLPMTVFSQDQQTGYADGERDAAADVSGGMWFVVGCVTGGISYIYAELANPPVPRGKLIGKSPEYVAGYTDGYNAKRKSIMKKNSCYGGLIYWGGCAIYVVIVVAAGVTY